MKSVPHTPYSLDLAASDFYLFGYVKRCLAGLSFEDADQLPAAIEGVLEGIEKVTVQVVFLEWMERLRKCIATNGEYTESAQTNVIEEWSFILLILRCVCPGGTPCTYYLFNEGFSTSRDTGVDPNISTAWENIPFGSRSCKPHQCHDNRYVTSLIESVIWLMKLKGRPENGS
jgi:hypothetical protein